MSDEKNRLDTFKKIVNIYNLIKVRLEIHYNRNGRLFLLSS